MTKNETMVDFMAAAINGLCANGMFGVDSKQIANHANKIAEAAIKHVDFTDLEKEVPKTVKMVSAKKDTTKLSEQNAD